MDKRGPWEGPEPRGPQALDRSELARVVQGYLAHKKQRPSRTLQKEYAQGPMVVWEFREPRGLQALDRSQSVGSL